MSSFIWLPMSMDTFIAGLPGSTFVSPTIWICWPEAAIVIVTWAVVEVAAPFFSAAMKEALSLYGPPASAGALVVVVVPAEAGAVLLVAGVSVLPQAATPSTAGTTMSAAAVRRRFHFTWLTSWAIDAGPCL